MEFESAISELKVAGKDIKGDKWKREEELAAQTKRKQLEEELKFEQEKFKRRLEPDKALAENKNSQSGSTSRAMKSTSTKLPKLVITQFSGKYMDWLKFWGQFKAEIDNSGVNSVTKFSFPKFNHVSMGYHSHLRDMSKQRTS